MSSGQNNGHRCSTTSCRMLWTSYVAKQSSRNHFAPYSMTSTLFLTQTHKTPRKREIESLSLLNSAWSSRDLIDALAAMSEKNPRSKPVALTIMVTRYVSCSTKVNKFCLIITISDNPKGPTNPLFSKWPRVSQRPPKKIAEMNPFPYRGNKSFQVYTFSWDGHSHSFASHAWERGASMY